MFNGGLATNKSLGKWIPTVYTNILKYACVCIHVCGYMSFVHKYLLSSSSSSSVGSSLLVFSNIPITRHECMLMYQDIVYSESPCQVCFSGVVAVVATLHCLLTGLGYPLVFQCSFSFRFLSFYLLLFQVSV